MSASKPLGTADQRLLADAIYYLKVSELRTVCDALGLSASGAKGSLIKRILQHRGIRSEDRRAISSNREMKFDRYDGDLDPSEYLLPGHYTNGPKMRAIFKRKIGDHFRFNNESIEWIRERWRQERYPTIDEFVEFWKEGFASRKEGSVGPSLMTNARVRFFRENKGKGLTKQELEVGWKKRRMEKVSQTKALLGLKENSDGNTQTMTARSQKLQIRDATEADLKRINEIFNQSVIGSTTIYEYDAWTIEKQRSWWQGKLAGGFPLFAAVVEDDVIGFSTYGTFRSRSAYQTTVERSVYLDRNWTGKGLGDPLIQHLIEHARTNGFHCMVAGADSNNQGSIAFHEKHGFERVGMFREVARKNGQWLNLVFLQKTL
jgi:L-amino acid N-acyltransferase YncA